jgi:hypothetical protein
VGIIQIGLMIRGHSMDFFVWSTIILAIWAAVGPLVGVRYGSELSKRVQREHWINDNAKQECREVLSTLTTAFAVIVRYHAVPISGPPISGPHDSGEMRERDEVERRSLETLHSRLFIADELEKRQIRERWVKAIRQYEDKADRTTFSREFGSISQEIRKIAEKFIG